MLKLLLTFLVGISYTYTTGSSALPDIYAQARGPQSTMYHIAHTG